MTCVADERWQKELGRRGRQGKGWLVRDSEVPLFVFGYEDELELEMMGLILMFPATESLSNRSDDPRLNRYHCLNLYWMINPIE